MNRIELMEAVYKKGFTHSEIQSRVQRALLNVFEKSTMYPWVVTLWSDRVVYSAGGNLFIASYTDDGSEVKITSEGTAVELAYVTAEESLRECELAEACNMSEAAASGASGRIRIIAPGLGSTGFYSADVLKRDGPKVFTEGLHMFWNHQTKEEASKRPEGDLNHLAGVLTSDAVYEEGPEGPGLYANAKWTNAYKDHIRDLAPHIGVSIRAQGHGREGYVNGQKTIILEELTRAKSVDFVTRAGAGGKVVELFEAAGRREPIIKEEKSVAKIEVEESDLTTLREAAGQIPALTAKLSAIQAALRQQSGVNHVRTFLDNEASLTEASRRYLASTLTNSVAYTADGTVDAERTNTILTEAVTEYKKHLPGAVPAGGVRDLGEAAAPTKVNLEEIAKNTSDILSRLAKAS